MQPLNSVTKMLIMNINVARMKPDSLGVYSVKI